MVTIWKGEIDIRPGAALPFNDYKIRGNITAIFLENKEGLKLETLIDTEELDRIESMDLHWHLRYDPSTKQYYARATGRKSEGQKPNYYLHMVILNHDFDKDNYYVVDHINQNKLDNRKENLRLIPQYNNLSHRKGANSNNKTGVRNVNLVTRYGGKQLYLVQIMRKGEKFKWEFELDEFDEACLFAELKRKELFGEYAGSGINNLTSI